MIGFLLITEGSFIIRRWHGNLEMSRIRMSAVTSQIPFVSLHCWLSGRLENAGGIYLLSIKFSRLNRISLLRGFWGCQPCKDAQRPCLGPDINYSADPYCCSDACSCGSAGSPPPAAGPPATTIRPPSMRLGPLGPMAP